MRQFPSGLAGDLRASGGMDEDCFIQSVDRHEGPVID